jgi:hypothetical protein
MIERLGHQFFATVRHALWVVVRSGLIAALVALVIAEIAGAILDGGWPQRLFVHVAALALALVVGYGVAMTVAFFEGIRGLVTTASEIEHEIEGGLRTTIDASTHGIGNVVDALEHHPHHHMPSDQLVQ